MFTKEQLELLKNKLTEEKVKLLERYKKKEDTQARIEEEVKEPRDLEDIGQMTYTQELLDTLSTREFFIIKEIEHALNKMQGGTYGICEYCGEEIPFERLLAIPWTRYHAHCAEKAEEEGIVPTYPAVTFETTIPEEVELQREDITEA
ncbi:MAG: TraR/DksA family transcriptional regulator [Aquificaceae bacterium]|nr:TraR/DksA family transcriptional regulator [Aquificaceae bacterium]MCX8164128.1 TraR/DksA family transcriptional regulator [Aquificaceae bacterium]